MDRKTKFFTIHELAQTLGVSDRTVSRWIDCGALVAYRIGHVVRIASDDVDIFLRQHRNA